MNTEQFYPTPRELLEKIFKDTDWRTVGSVLEPSAGNGDICDYIMEAAEKYPYYNRNLDMDCIEINKNRRAALKGKNYRVIFDDFIRFQTYKQYDLIAMNPPFADGEKHLLKALEMQKNGGCVMCILNAETLRNLYTNGRKLLVRKLGEFWCCGGILPVSFCPCRNQDGRGSCRHQSKHTAVRRRVLYFQSVKEIEKV